MRRTAAFAPVILTDAYTAAGKATADTCSGASLWTVPDTAGRDVQKPAALTVVDAP